MASNVATLMQVVAWALWYQKAVDEDYYSCDPCADPDCDEPHFDWAVWADWLWDHAHEPPFDWQCCGCRTYSQLCAWVPTPSVGMTWNLTELFKHRHPEFAISASLERKHPLFEMVLAHDDIHGF